MRGESERRRGKEREKFMDIRGREREMEREGKFHGKHFTVHL